MSYRLTVSQRFAVMDASSELGRLADDIRRSETIGGGDLWPDDAEQARTEYEWLMSLAQKLAVIAKARRK